MSGMEVALLAASTAISAVGAISAGEAQADQQRAAAAAAEYNANIQQQQAAAASSQASAREDLQRKQARDIIGRQMASTAESGSNLNGSAADLFRQSLFDAETDALNIRYEGELNRVGLTNQAALTRYEAGALREAASAASTSGYLSAAGALAGGAYRYSRAGRLNSRDSLLD